MLAGCLMGAGDAYSAASNGSMLYSDLSRVQCRSQTISSMPERCSEVKCSG